MNPKKVNVDGINIAYYEYGKTGDTVLFLHFMNGNAVTWNAVVPHFTLNFKVICIDLRGHGQSDSPDDGYDIQTMAHDVQSVLERLGLKDVHIVGSSLGCEIALYLAAYHTHLVRSIVLIDGAMFDVKSPNGELISKEYLLQELYSDLTEQEFDSIKEYVSLTRQHYGEQLNEYREAVIQEGFVPSLIKSPSGKWRRKTTKKIQRKITSSLYDVTHEELYALTTCPVLFIPSEQHRFFSYKNKFIHHMANLVSGHTKSVVIPGTQHIMVYDFPDELSREILTFFHDIQPNYN